MTLQEIVDKVIERILAIENRKNMLLIFHPDTKMAALEEVLVKIDRRHLKIGIVSFSDASRLQVLLKKLDLEVINLISSDDYIQMDYLMNRYDSVLVTGLNIGELYNLSIMNSQNAIEKLIMDVLMAKGKLYALQSVESNKKIHKQGLIKGLDKLYEASSEIGIEWIQRGATSKHLTQKVITCDALTGCENSSITIATVSVLTPLAKEYIKAHQIEIIRK